jgi:hypothetical protein
MQKISLAIDCPQLIILFPQNTPDQAFISSLRGIPDEIAIAQKF